MPLRSLRHLPNSRKCLLSAFALVLALAPGLAVAIPCSVPDAGGTAFIPPPGCGYLSPDDVHMIIAGLPAGTTIEVGAEHRGFTNVTVIPGGPLGGEIEQFDSTILLHLNGTGGLAGFTRNVTMQTQCETHTAPRSIGAPIQSFDTDMFRIQGQLPAGDPDFDLLRITAGTGFGMPSPGHTTLTQLPGLQWNVDSFFDITYRIDFIGRSPGPLAGMSGSTTATIRMQSGQPVPVPPCTVVDNGSGTIDLPPQGCGYVSPSDLHEMINGLPPGTTINIAAEHSDFFNVTHGPGGNLGGEQEQFSSFLFLDLSGTGGLQGYHRLLNIPVQCMTHIGPRTPGSPVQSFDTDMFMSQGQINGDPDFDLLRITGGTAFGMPSPGHTTLTQLPGNLWNVDSFFDITYRIDFVGRPGGPFGGMSGSTTATIRMQSGQPMGGAVDAPVVDTRKPREIALANRPNPFNPGTTIEYRLEQPSSVRLDVYDVAGKLVRRLTDAKMPIGPHAMYWDGRDDSGLTLGTGVYFVKISINSQVAGTTKVTMMK